jgi:hypothetical protein
LFLSSFCSPALFRQRGQVQANIDTLVILYVDRDLFRQTQGVAVGGFHSFEVSIDYVVGLAGADALGEFSGMIGQEFPLGVLIGHAADLDCDAVDGMIVWPPDGAEDESVGIGGLELFGRGSGEGQRQDMRAQSGEKENQQQA